MSPIRTMSSTLTSLSNPSVPSERGSEHDRMRRLRRRLSWHRRWWAAGFAAAAVFTAVQAIRPPSPETVQVLVAARDLPAGRPLRATDLEQVAYAAGTAPDGALAAEDPPTGRTLAAPVRAGTPLTDRSLVGRPLLRSLPAGIVAAPTRIADPELLRIVQVGDRVDVVAVGSADPAIAPTTAPEAGPAADAGTEPADGWAAYAYTRVVARDARVLAIPSAGPGTDPAAGGVAPGGSGGLVLLAVPPRTAIELAGTASPLSLVLYGTRS